jgi:hypothetical protein
LYTGLQARGVASFWDIAEVATALAAPIAPAFYSITHLQHFLNRTESNWKRISKLI